MLCVENTSLVDFLQGSFVADNFTSIGKGEFKCEDFFGVGLAKDSWICSPEEMETTFIFLRFFVREFLGSGDTKGKSLDVGSLERFWGFSVDSLMTKALIFFKKFMSVNYNFFNILI